ncbi:MAG TPA: hypothetical protein VJU86_09675 [Pyrinomonadaceae bacterium]|nr:hypothetical protein [Pyrinomonadaceae bacterium]
MKKLSTLVILLVIASAIVLHQSSAQSGYVPKAQFCADGSSAPCPIVPAYIGPDPILHSKEVGYFGLFGALPKTAEQDVETPFDNMSWQMFVALNYAANSVNQPAAKGLNARGLRVWQTYRKVSSLFGNSPVRARCTSALALPILYIGSDGLGHTEPNNEEYFQASTNLPLIDINGNWTIFERRVNDREASYLKSPNGLSAQTLTTTTGQTNFIKNNPKGVQFYASDTTQTGKNGSIEIKTAWRIIDRKAGDDPSRYYTQLAFIAVPGDLVNGGRQFCSSVMLGLVGMHIIQRNPVDPEKKKLLPEWIWATFEHVDNAPLAKAPCTVSDGCGTNPGTDWINKPSCGAADASASVRYSYYHQNAGVSGTNIGPKSTGTGKTKFPWNRTQPYAQNNTTSETSKPQVTRCWSIYPTTAQLNSQWQTALAALKTPFQNYMLIGTQWGGTVEPEPGNKVPLNAVPGMLSNMTLETYIQNYTGSDPNLPGPGSCIGCHSGATLAVSPYPSANFSFLPLLAQPSAARSKIKTPE